MSDASCQGQCPQCPRRLNPFGLLLQMLFVYILLVFAGGSLQHFDSPVAVELGRLIHTVTFVEPGIHWAQAQGFETVAGGMRFLAGGVDLPQLM